MKVKVLMLAFLLTSVLNYSDEVNAYSKMVAEPEICKKNEIVEANETVEKIEGDIFDVYDPLEPLNRRLYVFNYKLDKYLIIPVTKLYKNITPDFLEKGISNFFSNLDEVSTFLNSALQLKGKGMLVSGGRFLINTTLGGLGTMDPATRMGLNKRREDFGQTLGKYGVGSGPFLILPVLGPSNFRDLSGKVIDWQAYQYVDPLEIADMSRFDPDILALDGVDTRSRIPFSYYETGTPFEYEYIRLFYSKLRKFQIEN